MIENLANKNTEHSVIFQFQMNNEQCFSISMSHTIFGIDLNENIIWCLSKTQI